MTKFHPVFDTQRLFRSVLESMSYVGTIKNVHAICSGCDYNMDLLKVTQALAILYLDADTSFHVVDHKKAEEMVAMVTYSRKKDISEANTIFIPLHAQDQLAEVLAQVKEGSLINPHEGATIIVECTSCTQGNTYKCKGPGIQEEITMKISVDCEWVDARNDRNSEFPLGVDMIFVDKNFNILAIPRTTRIEGM